LSTEAVAAGRYRLVRPLGHGGMATVYLGHDSELDRPVAVKLLAENLAGDAAFRQRFLREARLAARLSHPNVVSVYDAGEEADGRPYIVMEHVDGETLADLLHERGRLPADEAVGLALQACRGLEHAHVAGLVHRDVKPQNLLLRTDGTLKIADFGIARAAESTGLTQAGTILGTAAYLSPEQALGEEVTSAADVYSLGAVLYELLTGEVPFRGDNFVAVAMRHINEPVPSVRERRPDVSPRLDAAIRRAMAKDPRERYPSMDVFAAELRGCLGETALDGGGPADETVVIAPRAREPARRAERPSVWPLILLLAGLAVLAGIFAAVFAFTGSTPSDFVPGIVHHPKAKAVRLAGVSGYDPYGSGGEHDDTAALATDGQATTYWRTEHYSSSLSSLKPGVGLLLDVHRTRKLSQVTVTSDTPGFTAKIEAGASPSGPFKPVSSSETVGSRTTFSLQGANARYYVVWITDLGSNASVHVNEVTAKSG
jgi:eukaryotic-like serine/threonine-protein kinase